MQKKVKLQITEKQFQRQVIDLARIYKWEVYHTWNSLHSNRGWPDLVLAKPPMILFVELKTDKGKLTPDQAKWIHLLGDCNCLAYCWKPSNWNLIVQTLSA